MLLPLYNSRLFHRCNERRLQRLDYDLHMNTSCLPRRVLFVEVGRGYYKGQGGQPLTWKRAKQSLTANLGAVGHGRLPRI